MQKGPDTAAQGDSEYFSTIVITSPSVSKSKFYPHGVKLCEDYNEEQRSQENYPFRKTLLSHSRNSENHTGDSNSIVHSRRTTELSPNSFKNMSVNSDDPDDPKYLIVNPFKKNHSNHFSGSGNHKITRSIDFSSGSIRSRSRARSAVPSDSVTKFKDEWKIIQIQSSWRGHHLRLRLYRLLTRYYKGSAFITHMDYLLKRVFKRLVENLKEISSNFHHQADGKPTEDSKHLRLRGILSRIVKNKMTISIKNSMQVPNISSEVPIMMTKAQSVLKDVPFLNKAEFKPKLRSNIKCLNLHVQEINENKISSTFAGNKEETDEDMIRRHVLRCLKLNNFLWRKLRTLLSKYFLFWKQTPIHMQIKHIKLILLMSAKKCLVEKLNLKQSLIKWHRYILYKKQQKKEGLIFHLISTIFLRSYGGVLKCKFEAWKRKSLSWERNLIHSIGLFKLLQFFKKIQGKYLLVTMRKHNNSQKVKQSKMKGILVNAFNKWKEEKIKTSILSMYNSFNTINQKLQNVIVKIREKTFMRLLRMKAQWKTPSQKGKKVRMIKYFFRNGEIVELKRVLPIRIIFWKEANPRKYYLRKMYYVAIRLKERELESKSRKWRIEDKIIE